MAPTKSLDDIEIKVIAALLHDIHNRMHGVVFDSIALKNTLRKVLMRTSSEGMGFLTKTLPSLGKAFDKALSLTTPLNAAELRFATMPNSKLPRFLGELFSRVLNQEGTPLQEPCTDSIGWIRQLCYLFYKYELPYSEQLEQEVVDRFVKTEDDLLTISHELEELKLQVDALPPTQRRRRITPLSLVEQTRAARRLLSNLFADFDCQDILPRHGPGAVATKQRLWEKYQWSNVADSITRMYPFDAYFCASTGAVCDNFRGFRSIGDRTLPARVILVPKDSRGPRLISCEPVDYQWVQQGLGRAIVKHVERYHGIRLKGKKGKEPPYFKEGTAWNVFFTDQEPNQKGALLGSLTGDYATLDLKDASDRVSTSLVRLLFPPHIYEYLEACRSCSTMLPSGKELTLRKFAPMGSCLCFPVMALTIWAILTAGAPDQDARDSILVYGDDVIVKRAHALDAIEQLESYGLLINRDKSCIRGFFRESCGVDAFKGINVTPVRIRTVWSSSPSPESYASWVSYANSLYDRKCFSAYDVIVDELVRMYGPIPGPETGLQGQLPTLPETPVTQRPLRTRGNKRYQKRQYYVLTLKSPKLRHTMDGWSMLLRYFTEKCTDHSPDWSEKSREPSPLDLGAPESVSEYTRPRSSILERSWR